MKYFITTDIHGCYAELRRELDLAGFDPENENHTFVSCGDNFDRGNDNRGVLDFLKSLKRKILIRGNHEDIMYVALESRSIDELQKVNGTERTLAGFIGCQINEVDYALKMPGKFPVLAELSEFIADMRDYAEIGGYVIVHGWIPLEKTEQGAVISPDWRRAPLKVWRTARWQEWFYAYRAKMTLPSKTIVCGHRHTAFGSLFDKSRPDRSLEPFIGEGIIALDANTHRSGKLNVFTVEAPEPETVTHEMHLDGEPFDKIASGEKTVEMRMLDEKRAKIKPGDCIVFENGENGGEKLTVSVVGLYAYPDFTALAADFMPAELGLEGVKRAEIGQVMTDFYGEKAEKYKALAIRVAVIPR